jgi:hypothetical protein
MGTLSFGGPHSAAAEAGFIFSRLCGTAEAVPFPVVVNPPVLAEQNLLGLGCETQSACVFASQAFLVAVRQTFRS